jgi:hypothetical protein
MPPLLRRSLFATVLATGAVLFGAGVQGVTGMDTTLQLAAERTDDRPVLVRYDQGRDCPDTPHDPRT